MSRTFELGDRVRVNCAGWPLHGHEAVIERIYRDVMLMDVFTDVRARESVAYGISIDAEHVYTPSDLVPLYDGNEKVSWSECLWQPRVAA